MKDIDILHGSLPIGILRFAFPLALTGIIQQLFNAADIAVLGQFVGKNAMAAVGSDTPIISLLVNMFVGISLGANVVIAQNIGDGNRTNVQRAVQTSVIIAVGGGLIMGAVGELISGPVLELLGVPPEILPMSEIYLRIYLLGMPVILLYNFEAAIFRSRGDTKTPLYCLVFSGLLNVALNLFFVLKLGMTADGVAWATVISNLSSAALLFFFLSRGPAETAIRLRGMRLHRNILKRILRIGVPSGLQGMVFSLSNICIQSAINSLGAAVMAASSAAFNIEVLAYFVLNSFGQACTTFVGQNYGALNFKRCRSVLKVCLAEDAVFSGVSMAAMLLWGRQILMLFNSDPDVLSYGYTRLVYVFSAYAFTLLIEVLSGYLRGFGMSMLPAAAAIFGICGLRIAWLYFIFYRYPSFPMLMAVYPVTLGVTAILIVGACLVCRPSRFLAAAKK